MEAGQKPREFKVVLHGIELTEKQERALSGAIQRTVADHLAGLDLDGEGEGDGDGTGQRHLVEIGGKFPDWIGRQIALIAAGDLLHELENAAAHGGGAPSPTNLQSRATQPRG